MAAPKTTRIADDTTQAAPQTTAAGDAPADTYDPLERVSSAATDKAAAAGDGYLTVNAVEPVASAAFPTSTGNRTEVISAFDATGTAVTLVHNMDTGLTVEPLDWEATTDYAAGDYVIVTDKVLQATTAGKSGAAAPTAPATVGATVTDGTAVWTRRT